MANNRERNTKQNGRLPLELPATERAALGSIIRDVNAYWEHRDRLKPELFTTARHRAIVAVLHKMADSARGKKSVDSFGIAGIVARLPIEDQQDGEDHYSPEGYLANLVYEESNPDALPDNLHELEEAGARRALMAICERGMAEARDDNGRSALERLDAVKLAIDTIADPIGASQHVRHISEVSADLLKRMEAASDAERPIGIPVGLKGLQDRSGLLMPGRLYALIGPPGSGKTALAQQVATFIAQSYPVLISEMEMEAEELAERDLAWLTSLPTPQWPNAKPITADKIEQASVSISDVERLWEAQAMHNHLKLWIDDTSGINIAEIRARALRHKRVHGLGVLIIDTLLHVEGEDARDGEWTTIRKVMRGAKRIAKDLQIAVVVLGQLVKSYGEGPWKQLRRPNVNDIFGGSAVEQESDVILFVHRPEYLLRKKEPEQSATDRADWMIEFQKWVGKAEIGLGKRRGGPPALWSTVYWDGATTRFNDSPPRDSTSDLLDQAGVVF